MGIRTSEFVSPRHPDKTCDFIADSIVDAYLRQDKASRIAVEVMGGHRHLTVSGEITSKANVDIKDVVLNIVGLHFNVDVHATRQSPQIARGVDTGGAGDQGIMIGHATNHTPNLMPYEYELARSLCKSVYEIYPYDGKVQVTVDGPRVLTVVASFQNTRSRDLEKLVRSLIKADVYLINPAGEWDIGGFDADSGLSGRKIVVDNYGPEYPVGGGSFSGKDYTKVDRSGAYIARKIAVDLLSKHEARRVDVKLAYAIGKAEPVMKTALIDGVEIDLQDRYDLTPSAIRDTLRLDELDYASTSTWGHFGNNFEWDRPFDSLHKDAAAIEVDSGMALP